MNHFTKKIICFLLMAFTLILVVYFSPYNEGIKSGTQDFYKKKYQSSNDYIHTAKGVKWKIGREILGESTAPTKKPKIRSQKCVEKNGVKICSK